MDIGSLLLGFALLLVVALFVVRPFLQGQLQRPQVITVREALQAQKEALLEQIRVLDFELETGKLPDDEHARQRAQLLQEAAAVLKELDRISPPKVTNGSATRIEREIEAAIADMRASSDDETSIERTPAAGIESQIEAAVRNARLQPHSGAPGGDRTQDANGASHSDEVRAASPLAEAPPSGARFCAQCGNRRDARDKFCAYCGFRFS